ncbi:Spy/CpxP family protein refolding chaperone [Alloacidobacterium dinghuense]|uniref:Spy/CpxP family protein refolding chaperone n=1 Tax=Alloacidobacterium dinghuense TaxID=2763107 RepID=A0A7G8BJK1_9BACT|nr:Spy/CpxP family protein refolding chaperone [Alloacidobacterium dinghuense]QNI32721.1 Spy/CpxP family protein refolding chaperone [Alloacidobacterium dinghuense]
MKRKVIWASIILALVVTGITIVRAETRGWHGWCGRGLRHPGPLGYVAHELDLSNTQISQIKSLWQAERPTISALVHEAAAEVREMDAATVEENQDVDKVQEIASRQGATIAKLLIEKEQLSSKIYTSVLTPVQRTQADELQKRWHLRLDKMADRLGSASGRE